MRRSRVLLAAAAWALSTAAGASGEMLPLRSYTTADGLAHDRVKRIATDRDGFVWFGTLEGLSRFDGRRFVTFGAEAGLPVPSVNDILETPRGLWVATNGGGVAFFEPDAVTPRFRAVSTGADASSRVNVLALDGRGTLWAGTDGGLFRLDDGAARRRDAVFRSVPLGIPGREDASVPVTALLPNGDGVLVGTSFGLVLVGPDGTARPVPLGRSSEAPGLALASGRNGSVLVGHGSGGGLDVLDAQLRVVRRWRVADGLPNGVVTALLVQGERVFIGTEGGLAVLSDGRLSAYGTREGLSDGRVSTLAADQDGGIWIGTPEGGAMRLFASGSSVFGEEDGFGKVSRFFEGARGEVCGGSPGWSISCFDGQRFTHAAPRFASRLAPSSWRAWYGILRDHEGALWIGTGEGLYRFAALSRIEHLSTATPIRLYTKRDGLANDGVAQLLEDRSGDVWIGSFAPVREPLTVWRRATGRFERFGNAAGLPETGSPAVLGLDAAGDVWVSYRDGTLARQRDGRFRILSGRGGFPVGHVTGLASDPSGRLWGVAEGGIVLRVDAPSAEEPTAVVYGRPEGVAGYYLSGLVIDARGRVVFGTDRELLRLDPADGAISKVLPDRVLVQSSPASAFRDRSGALWFGTWHGTVRILPVEERRPVLAHVRISGVKVSGIARPVHGRGADSLDLGEVAPSANISFDFFGLGAVGQPLSFTHLLEGAEPSWSPPQEERSVHFAHFPPGRYRFCVRAAGPAGDPGLGATVSFSVAVPFWRRWWFAAGVVSLFAAAGYSASALRVRHRRQLEDVRSRIASDLHDDLGAGLSRISILAEVASLAIRNGTSPGETVARIGDAAREVDERLSEGIWTVDPSHDDLASLCRRLCLLAAEILEPAGIAWRVTMPDGAESVRLGPDRRREIYLLLKEAFANVARHSGARHAVLTVALCRPRLVFELADDGCGLPPGGPEPSERLVGGRGLVNMRTRAEALDGTLRVGPAPGHGTVVTLDLMEHEDA